MAGVVMAFANLCCLSGPFPALLASSRPGRPGAVSPTDRGKRTTQVKAVRLDGGSVQAADIEGRVLTHDLGPDLRKGTVLGAVHLSLLRGHREVHAVELEPGDIHEDEAGRRLADAIAKLGPLRFEGPAQSQYRIVATRRGLLRVNAELVGKINALSGIALFTLFDGQAVEAGEEVAGCKVTPVAVPEQVVREAS